MNNQREKYVEAKKEGEDNNNPLDNNKQISRLSTTSSSRQWGGFKNPRIVRVSRAFGGKDRHSKVCTIRGLRDRRIRLSVPTAIQLYDLQDRLGLNQPSKVVDWLLDATKDEIDKLPPLQLPPGGFFPQDYSSSSLLANRSQVFGSHPFERRNNLTSSSKANQENLENYEGYVSHHHHQLSAQNFFPLGNQTSSLQGLLNNNDGLSYNSNYLHWEPPNLSLSQFGNHPFDSQVNNTTSNNSSSALQPSSLSSHHQLYFCPSIPTVPSMISPTYPPPFMNLSSSSMENEQSRQMMINNFQLSSSSSSHVPNSLMPTTLHLINSPMKAFGFNVSPFKVSPGQENDDYQQNKKG
ncbi:hypothetical protein Leryth_021894 [Lithospermum erythrorhizon]|uniref:DNA-binding transcription factor n=1 Tax=Lithospermum erythrorhizon TaxID=34254 RepID=A0AAV3RAY6_LITER|nr:hypothetical protein Leryth_021894 [Lithospermum erythrorhizon]